MRLETGSIKQIRRAPLPPKQYKCMNCGKVIENPDGDLYTRRFCSEKCRSQYLAEY